MPHPASPHIPKVISMTMTNGHLLPFANNFLKEDAFGWKAMQIAQQRILMTLSSNNCIEIIGLSVFMPHALSMRIQINVEN
jgi:hypothetical protein